MLRRVEAEVEAKVEAGWGGLRWVEAGWGLGWGWGWGGLRPSQLSWILLDDLNGGWGKVEAGWGMPSGLEFSKILTFTVNTSLYSNLWPYMKANLSTFLILLLLETSFMLKCLKDFKDSPESKFLLPSSIWLWAWTWTLASQFSHLGMFVWWHWSFICAQFPFLQSLNFG